LSPERAALRKTSNANYDKLNVADIIARGDKDLYLSDNGVNKFEELEDPQV
jgi:hypothetical protein